MFLLVSSGNVGAHLDGHQHGVSIQISINLGKKFLRISPIRSIAVTWILARVFAYLPSFFSQILDLIYLTVLIFIFIYSGMAWHRKPAIATAAQDWLKSKTSDHQKCWNKILLKSYHLVRDYPKINTHTIAHTMKIELQYERRKFTYIVYPWHFGEWSSDFLIHTLTAFLCCFIG